MLVFNGGQKNKGELREKPFGAKTQLRFYSIESTNQTSAPAQNTSRILIGEKSVVVEK